MSADTEPIVIVAEAAGLSGALDPMTIDDGRGIPGPLNESVSVENLGSP
jgi:hypothetical protein